MSDPTTIGVSQPADGQEVEVRLPSMYAFRRATYHQGFRVWELAPGWLVSTSPFDEWRPRD